MLPLLAFLKGIAIGLWGPADYPAAVREIAALGADHVSLVVSWTQEDVRATALRPGTCSDVQLRTVIRAAHAAGLKVLLFPIVEVERRAQGEWRGTVAPADVAAWWSSYERFILHYAGIAAAEKVALYSVGSELVSTEAWRDRWYHLISRVERVYRGPLVYSANWDHYQEVSFWERVAFVGVNGYFEVARDADASEATMQKAWLGVRGRLTAFAGKLGKPLLFTEVGYPSRDGGAVRPWDYTSETAVDVEEQRRAYAAFVAAWQDEPALAGVFFWDWRGEGGARDRGYTPRGKPAEAVLRAFFAAK